MTCPTNAIHARRIAIIGAGPSGVVAAKYLCAEEAFEKIVLFEQRSRSGGIWNYTPDLRGEDLLAIPQTNPKRWNQSPEWKATPGKADDRVDPNDLKKTPLFLSPMYENLETNIPRGLMGFNDLKWPKDTQLFPTHESVLEYIEAYGKEVQHLVQYETQVIKVQPFSDNMDSAWTVQTRHLRSGKVNEETFDAVIVANGHFIVPYIPDIPGIREWDKRNPGLITHSKYYRRPSDFVNKKVIVVGNSASGADISNQIAQYCLTPLIWSTRSISLFSATHDSAETAQKRKEYRPIKQLLPSSRGVEFQDGVSLHEIDAIVFATGYFYSLPFLEDVKPPLITDGSHVNNTYQHLFFSPRPTLSFLALNQRVVPFPIAEAQSAVIARIYAGRLSLPALPEMQAWESSRKAEIDSDRNFHLLPFPKDGEYLNSLSQWALRARTKEGLINGGKGKIPPVWGEWEFWCRENFPSIRRAFSQLGEKRKHITSIDDLGFSFENYVEEQQGKPTENKNL